MPTCSAEGINKGIAVAKKMLATTVQQLCPGTGNGVRESVCEINSRCAADRTRCWCLREPPAVLRGGTRVHALR